MTDATGVAASPEASLAIVVPCWNYGAFLPECLDSLLAQTVAPAEVVLVNDASSDHTETIALEYRARWPRLRYVSHAETRGCAQALNTGIDVISAPWAACVSADDWVAPEFVERHLSVIAEHSPDPTLAIVYSVARYVATPDAERPELHGRAFGLSRWDPNALFAGHNFIHGGCAFRRDLWAQYGRFREEPNEDFHLWCRMARDGYRGELIPEVLYYYRQHGLGHRNYGTDTLRRALASTRRVA